MPLHHCLPAAPAICAALILGPAAGLAAGTPTERVFLNGHIITMNPETPRADALATRGDTIVAVGTNDEARAAVGERPEIVDLDGRTVLPGFIDAHGHFPFGVVTQQRAGGLPNRWMGDTMVDVSSPPVGDIESIDDIVERIDARAADLPAGEWIRGLGYDDTLLAEHRHPTRADLDRATADHPVYLSHVSGHAAVANSMALELAGVTAETPQPDGGHIYMDGETGAPTGLLEEPSAMKLVAGLLPQPTDAELIEAAEVNGMAYATVGVTSAQMGAAAVASAEPFVAAWRQGRLPIRVEVWPVMFEVAGRLRQGEDLPELPDTRHFVRYGALKGFADGSIQAYTGYLREPYYRHDKADPGYRGYPAMPRDALINVVSALHAAGYQLAIHANGDAAIDDVLDAFEAAQKSHPRADARHIVVHAQMATPGQLQRMADGGWIPSFFNLHVYYWGDRHRDIFLGPERAARISPAHTALEKGLDFTLHADSPVVPLDPMLMVTTAVTRRTLSGAVLGPAERIGVMDALRALTINAARQGFQEDLKGSLEPGKLADFIMLDADPTAVDVADIADIQVLETWVGGRSVYQRD